MTDKLRVGIAGYGVVGKRRRQYIDRHPDLVTVAVSDRSFGRDGTLDDGVRFHDDYRKLLDENLDVLFVSLSNDLTAEATIGGLERGFHVFAEKPPGRTLEEVAKVIAVERRHPGLKLKYGFNHRYHDSVKEALALVRSGELGNVINLRGVYGKSVMINFESDWRTERRIAGGGILLDQGIHMVDLMRIFGGEYKDVHSIVANSHWHHDVEDNAYALMKTADGKVAFLHSSATQWRHRFNLEIALDGGTVILDGILSGSKSYGAETLTVARKAPGDKGDPQETTRHFDYDPSWEDEIAEFADCVTGDRPIITGSSDDALRTLHLVYRIYCADPAWKAAWGLSDRIPEIR